jgi:hypothetical protein
MATYVQQTGPVSVCVNANSWGTYTGGILKTCNDLDGHCVQVVGVDVGNYWKVFSTCTHSSALLSYFY